MRICSRCKENEVFSTNSMCRDCYRDYSREYARKYRAANKEKVRRYNERYYSDPEKREKSRVRARARQAFPEPQLCEVEGCEELGQRHHDDYGKPYDIRWLCIKHHHQEHSDK